MNKLSFAFIVVALRLQFHTGHYQSIALQENKKVIRWMRRNIKLFSKSLRSLYQWK